MDIEKLAGFKYFENEDGTYTVKGLADTSANGVVIPEGVSSISARAFDYDELEYAVIPEGVKSIGEEAFRYGKFSEITLPQSLERLGEKAFAGCDELKEITVPAKVTGYIHAFEGCQKLKKATLCEGIKKLDSGAFAYCRSLTEAVLPDGLKKIQTDAFLSCESLKEIDIPDSVEKIGSAFVGCEGLVRVKLPRGIKKIGTHTFLRCKSLEEIVIPEGVTEIASWAFSGCESLKTVTLPSSLTKIDGGAFENCKNLTDVFLPSGLKEISGSAFASCDKVKLHRQSGNPADMFAYTEKDGGLTVKKLKFNLPGDTVKVPEGTRVIAAECFEDCVAAEIILPAGLEKIENRAFRNCNKLKSIELPDGVKTIGAGAFERCSALEKIYIPDSVEKIGDDAFLYCSRLEIYCGGEPKKGWIDKPPIKKEYDEDMTEAFNFHRSSGSWADRYIEHRVEVTDNCYNPGKRPVHVNVTREEFLKPTDK